MKRFVVATIAALGVLTAAVPAAHSGDVNMQEGKWETTMEMTIEGLPFPMPPIKSVATQCITKKDMVPNTADKKQKCEVKDQKVTGNTVTWKTVCTDKDSVSESQGKITYTGAGYTGAIKTKTTDKKGQVMTSTANMSGKRVGGCDK